MDGDPWAAVESSGVSGMSFLFQKVSPSIFDVDRSRSSSLIDVCLERCLTDSATLDGQLEILLSATLKRIITLFRDDNRPLSLPASARIMDYVCKKWDCSVDVICYECCDVFSMLLDIHTNHCNQCVSRLPCPFVDDVCAQLFGSPSTCRSLFKCINTVLRAFPGLKKLDDDFIERLYAHLENPSLSVVISEIISQELSNKAKNTGLHRSCLLKCLLSPKSALRSAAKDRLVPMLMKNPPNREFIADLLDHIEGESCADTDVQLDASLSIAKILVHNSGPKRWSDFVPVEIVGRAILHNNPQVRLSAWSLVCIHPRTTVPFTSSDLALMRAFLVSSGAEQSPAVRQKILSSFKQVLTRMAETSEQVLKGKTEDNGLLEQYEDFMRFVINLSFDSLSPGANFSRRVFSLSMIDSVFRQKHLSPNGKTAFVKRLNLPSFLTEERFSMLLACLDDSFQLCQILSLDLLKSLEFQGEFDIERFHQDSVEIMTSIRSHNTLSSGYRFQYIVQKHPERLTAILTDFIHTCGELTALAEKDLMSITSKPIHPIMNAIVSLVKSARSFEKDKEFWNGFCKEKLLPLCFRVAALVTPVVHSMAPEGYIPEEKLCQLAGDASGSLTRLHADVSQLLLACCWRAHKHVSELFDWSVSTLFPQGLLTACEVHRIGEYFWLQLTECRHCGAFESAVEGFTSMCSFLWKTNDPSLPHPMHWLIRILKALTGGEDLDNLCSTRRSAGVPHLVVAILATEPSKKSVALETAVSGLLKMEEKDLKFRIHSLNVLKAIFHSSALSERVAFALEGACRLAVTGCSSASWSERNSSAQLAAALRTHIFGVTRSSQRDLVVDAKNRQSAHEFFSRFPSLYSFLYHQLENVRDEFSLYPTLIFLTHLFPTSTATKFHLAPFIPMCLKCLLWIKSEKLRKLSAAATIAISQREDIDFILKWIETLPSYDMKQNHLHAVLLLLSSINSPEYTGRIAQILAKLMDCFSGMCDYNTNILLDLVNRLNVSAKVSIIPEHTDLSKRQIALLWLRSGCIPSIDDMRVRLEIYRWLDLHEAPLALDSASPISQKQLIVAAVHDLSDCFLESDSACIMRVLESSPSALQLLDLENREDLATLVVKAKLDDFVMPATVAAAQKLLYKMGAAIDDVVDWAESTYDLEDEYPKRQAIEICCGFYEKDPRENYLETAAVFLQDEDSVIRDEAAKTISPLLGSSSPLNPEICRYLLSKRLNTSKPLKADEGAGDGDDGLFDSCMANVYAETRLFGDFSVIDQFVQ